MHEIKILDIRRDRDGSFVRETTIVDSSREDQEKRRIKQKKRLY